MILRHRLRHSFHPRPGTPGRGHEPGPRASDVILMIAGLFVAAAILKILQG